MARMNQGGTIAIKRCTVVEEIRYCDVAIEAEAEVEEKEEEDCNRREATGRDERLS